MWRREINASLASGHSQRDRQQDRAGSLVSILEGTVHSSCQCCETLDFFDAVWSDVGRPGATDPARFLEAILKKLRGVVLCKCVFSDLYVQDTPKVTQPDAHFAVLNFSRENHSTHECWGAEGLMGLTARVNNMSSSRTSSSSATCFANILEFVFVLFGCMDLMVGCPSCMG